MTGDPSPKDKAMAHSTGPQAGEESAWQSPASNWQAVLRGIRNRCPNCGEARFFPRFLKPLETCPVCHQDWARHRADDFPAYLSIFITGHLMAPVIIAIVSYDVLPAWALALVLVTMVVVLSILLLQPAKGAVMALLWRLGVNGRSKAASGKKPV